MKWKFDGSVVRFGNGGRMELGDGRRRLTAAVTIDGPEYEAAADSRLTGARFRWSGVIDPDGKRRITSAIQAAKS